MKFFVYQCCSEISWRKFRVFKTIVWFICKTNEVIYISLDPQKTSMKQQRQNLNIELADGNKDQLENVRAWNGMTQKEMVSRLINWFCKQDRVIQQVILGVIPEEIAPDVAQAMLKNLSAGKAGATPSVAPTPSTPPLPGEPSQPVTGS